MARTIVLQDRFDRGMVRDTPIDQLPQGAVWNLVDMLPGLKGGLSRRSSWAQHSDTVSSTYCAAVGFAPFAAASQIIAINSAGALKQVNVSSGAVTARGTAQVPYQSPVFYREKVYIQSDNGTTTVKSYNGASDAVAATGSPPTGMFATVFKDHLVLARDATNPNRVWFSNGGDAGVWDTAADGQWLDLSYVPNGIATLRNMILVFGENAMERIRGDIIPGVAGSDMVKEIMFNVGCADPAAIAVSDDYLVFTNPNGVYMTDGIGLVDLTEQCGIKSLFRNTVGGALYTFTGGLWQGYYIVSILTGAGQGAFTDCFCFDIARRRAWRFTNVAAAMMVTAPSSSDALSGELFFAERARPNVSRLSTMWSVEGYGYSGGTTDGNAVYSSPSVQTGYLRGLPGKKRWRRLFVTYHLEDFGTNNPTVAVSWEFNATLDATAGTTTIAETSETASTTPRARIPITGSVQSDGISVGLAGTNLNTDDFRVFMIEAQVQPLEQSR